MDEDLCADALSAGMMQSLQRDYDQVHWEHPSGRETLRHVLLHLVKLTGKVAGVVEAQEHGANPSTEIIEAEVIPDLLHNAWRLANDLGISAAQMADLRWEQLAARQGPG